ncbi:DUF6301 family protein [Nocardia salmonicida]|uniref:DUF6301 family protein n=1 Tax=Nocardia salmonicida TaxID=53431 RepID=UPI003436CFFA
MNVDTQGAIDLAILASRFAWSWTDSDFASLREEAGWTVSGQSDLPSEFVTSIQIDHPVGRISRSRVSPLLPGQTVEYLRVRLSQPAELEAGDGYADTNFTDSVLMNEFAALGRALVSAIGPVSVSQPGRMPKLCWEYPTVVIAVSASYGYLDLVLYNPEYRRWLIRLDELNDDDDDDDDHDDDDDDDHYDDGDDYLTVPPRYSRIISLEPSWPHVYSTFFDAISDMERYDVIDVSTDEREYLQISYDSAYRYIDDSRHPDFQLSDTVVLICKLFIDPIADARYLNDAIALSAMANAGWIRIENESINLWHLSIDWPVHDEVLREFVDKAISVLRDCSGIVDPTSLELRLI